jgi:hypothetical protein
LRAALESAYGKRLLLDYENNRKRPLADQLRTRITLAFRQFAMRRSFDLVYGHFDPAAYSAVAGPRAMFFRDPAKRTVSHYFYLRERGKLASVELADFAAQPAQRDMYDFYTGGRGVDGLAFVGITEAYADSLRLFRALFGVELEEHVKRAAVTPPPPDSLLTVAPFQAANQRVYDAAKRRFDTLCRTHL